MFFQQIQLLLGIVGLQCAASLSLQEVPATRTQINDDRLEHIIPIDHRSGQFAQHDTSHGNIVLAWTPRAACTFVMELWFRFLGCYEEAVEYNPFLHAYRIGKLGDNPHGGRASESDLLGKHNFKFKIVMNPYLRAVTMFEHSMSLKNLGHDNFTFIEWLHYLHRDNAHGGFYDKDTIGKAYHSHYAPQVAVKRNDASLYDVICQLEDDLAECLSKVNSKTGANFSVPSLNSKAQTNHDEKHKHVEGDVANIAYPQFESLGLPFARDYYAGESGPKAAKIVRKLYRFDFEAYGYSMEGDDVLTLSSVDFYDLWS